MITNTMNSALPKMRPWMKALSTMAFIVSVIYTIKFNIGTATSLDDKILSGATGFLQDATEVGFALFGIAIIADWAKQSKTMRLIGIVCLFLSASLILWSITSTWGANSAMIDGSQAASQFERKKLELIESTMQQNSAAYAGMEANAAAIRAKAERYGVKYTSKAIDKIQEAQAVSEKAGRIAAGSMAALDELNKIDRELIGNVNSAQAAFDRLSAFFNSDPNTVGTTFLLTRATQLELIGILAAVFVIFVPPLPKEKKRDTNNASKTNANSVSQSQQSQPVTQYHQPVTATAQPVKQPFGFMPPGSVTSAVKHGGSYTPRRGVTRSYKTGVTQENTHSPACNTRKKAVTRNTPVTRPKDNNAALQKDSVTVSDTELNLICNAILKQGVTPTTRSMRWFLKSQNIGSSIRARDNIAEQAYAELLKRDVIIKQQQKGGIKKAAYKVNQNHSEYISKPDPAKESK